MTILDAVEYDQDALIKALDKIDDQEIEVVHINGQRYLGCGWKNSKTLILRGTAGNNLGAFAEGPHIVLYGNGQEGVGNTMSEDRSSYMGEWETSLVTECGAEDCILRKMLVTGWVYT